MSKPKFKVGDKVIGTKGANIYTVTCKGWIGEVEKVGLNGWLGDIMVKGKSDIPNTEGHYTVNSSLFELYKPPKIIIYRNGSEVIAKNTATGKTGVARCNPADEFDFNVGAKLAFERLTNPEPEKPKTYTGKVVCVASPNKDFTVGKIYTFENGKTQDNDGYYRPTGYSLKEFRDGCCFTNSYKFIPLIED